MGFLAFLLIGLIIGAVAKLIMPGRQGGGWFTTLLLGVVGAMVGGWFASVVFNVAITDFWSLWTWIFAIIGALIVLLIYWLIFGRRRAKA